MKIFRSRAINKRIYLYKNKEGHCLFVIKRLLGKDESKEIRCPSQFIKRNILTSQIKVSIEALIAMRQLIDNLLNDENTNEL